MMRTLVLRLCGHVCSGPRGVVDQSFERMSAPSSPPPLRTSANACKLWKDDSVIVRASHLFIHQQVECIFSFVVQKSYLGVHCRWGDCRPRTYAIVLEGGNPEAPYKKRADEGMTMWSSVSLGIFSR